MYHNIKVTTFKESGKYYDEFNITIESQDEWYHIIEAVRNYKEHISEIQSDMDWLIGMDDSRNDMYPIMLK